MAFPSDTSFRLGSHKRVPVEVETSGGDHEVINLFRVICPPRVRGPYFECFQYTIMMLPGHSASELAGLVAEIGDRYLGLSLSGQLASIMVFDPEDLIRHAERAREWPGVSIVQLVHGASGPGGFASDPRGWLMSPIRVDSGSAVPGDGRLQIGAGDTVEVRYTQPTGGLLTSLPRIIP
jgi:hypothetical protein